MIRQAFRERLARFLVGATGSSTRIAKAVLLDTPLSIDRGEVTDKGSVNQRAVLEHRAKLIDDIYANAESAKVIAI
jgi:feruloyl-CoA synthase